MEIIFNEKGMDCREIPNNENIYPKIIDPFEERLSRIRNGIWKISS